jgi:hypothetical protein
MNKTKWGLLTTEGGEQLIIDNTPRYTDPKDVTRVRFEPSEFVQWYIDFFDRGIINFYKNYPEKEKESFIDPKEQN